MEEAAASLGRVSFSARSPCHCWCPALPAPFAVRESLADLGTVFIAGNRTVRGADLLAVIGEYNYRSSALALVLIIPTLIIFLVQRYYVNRKSYISVTGKPAGAQIIEKDPFIRWTVIIIVYLVIAFIILLYATIIYGSFSAAWGVDFTPTLRHWEMTVTRGIEAILDTTFLSALATPFAALLGMVIAWLVVRKKFSGKDVLDFSSNLGGAVPGTILGIGFVLAFNKPPLALAVVIYAILALFFAQAVKKALERILILVFGTAAGVAITLLDQWTMYMVLGGIYLGLAVLVFIAQRKIWRSIAVALVGVYVMSYNWANAIAKPIADFSRSLERGFWSNAIFQVADHIKVLVQPTPALLAIALILAGIILFQIQE